MQKYNEYLHEVSLTADHRYTFQTLSKHTDQILALYERELIILTEFRDKHVNNNENLKLLGKSAHGKKITQVNQIIINKEYDSSNTQLTQLIELVNMLKLREINIQMNIRELGVIITRIQHMNSRNNPTS